MKITDVTVHVVNAPGDSELVEGSRLGWVFVEVETDEGLTGIGECSNWPERGNAIVARTLDAVRPALIGRDPSQIEAIWSDLFRRYTYLGNRGIVTTVMSGIDIALWDLRGKVLGRPVWDLIGGPVRDRVPLYSHTSGATPEAAATNTRRIVGEGFDAVKLDPFREMLTRFTSYIDGRISRRGLHEGVELVTAVREAAGPDVEVLVDMHGNFDVPSAVTAIKALEPYDVAWFEEPVPPEGIAALRQVRELTGAMLCVGERLRTRWDFLPVLEARVAAYLMPDVCWTGGVTELKKIATMAETWFVPVSPHNALGPLQILAGGHVMLTVPNLYRLEINSDWLPWYNSCIDAHLPVVDGNLVLTDRPGLGADFNHDFITDNADRSWLDVTASATD